MAKFILKALVKARGPEVRVVKTMAVSHHFPSSRVKVWVTKKGVHMYLP